MSPNEPESPTPAEAPRSVPSRGGGGARRLDLLSGVLLLSAGVVAAVAAAPAVMRVAGAPLPHGESPGAAPTLDLPHVPPEILRDPEKLVDPDHDADQDDIPFAPTRGHGQLGHARGAALLRDRPAEVGKSVGEIKAGELVMILKESGDWLQVWASGGDGVVMGWVKKSGIAVR